MERFIDIILLALIAGFLIWRLRSVLGRRTEDEGSQNPPFTNRNSQERGTRTNRNGNVIPLPASSNGNDLRTKQEEPIDFSQYAPKGSTVQKALYELHRSDRNFHPAAFLTGAKSAYELIVTSFAAGDRSALKPLLSEGVYNSFDNAISDRESKQLTVESEFIGVDKTEILDASISDQIAKITVKFISDLVSTTKNVEGDIVEGDPTKIKRVTDIWTFARDTSSQDPNWKLVGTSAASA